MKLSATQALLLAGVAFAQNPLETTGPGPYENASIWQNANQNPISQESAQFSLWYEGSDSSQQGPQWTWRVAVAKADISDSDVPNAAQLNQVYSFEWPNGGSLQSAVAQSPANLNQSSFCVTVVESVFTKGTTNRYDPDTKSNAADNSCKSSIADMCQRAIVERAMTGEIAPNGCRLTDVDIGSIYQCERTIGGSFSASTYNLIGPNVAGNAANGTFPLMSGDGFAHITTQTYDGSNTTYEEVAASRLQMVIVESGNTVTPLCLRINTDSDIGTKKNAAPATGVNGWLAGAAVLFAAAYLL